MRGKPNLYKAVAVRLLGQIVRYDLLVNNVPVAKLYPEKRGMNIVPLDVKRRMVRINPALVERAVAEVH